MCRSFLSITTQQSLKQKQVGLVYHGFHFYWRESSDSLECVKGALQYGNCMGLVTGSSSGCVWLYLPHAYKSDTKHKVCMWKGWLSSRGQAVLGRHKYSPTF